MCSLNHIATVKYFLRVPGTSFVPALFSGYSHPVVSCAFDATAVAAIISTRACGARTST